MRSDSKTNVIILGKKTVFDFKAITNKVKANRLMCYYYLLQKKHKVRYIFRFDLHF